jgi:hypothetical protein
MKKGTILRNDAPHAVKMPEGSKVAARKVKKETASVPVPEEVSPPPVTRKSVSPKVKTAKDKPAPEKVATKPRAKPKTKAKADPQAPDAVAPTQAVASAAPVLAPRVLPLPIDEAAIWEKDNPVKSRMTQLKARNALLEEQLQRLQSPFQARGRKP